MKSTIIWVFTLLLGDAWCHSEYVDLTHDLHNTMVHWPGPMFKLRTEQAGKFMHLDWAAWNSFDTPEHMGTHIDSPYHFYEHGKTIDKIPLNHLHGPAVVIDIKERAKRNGNAVVMVKDITKWESRHGRIPDGAFVMMNSGWDRWWKNDDSLGAVGSLNETDKLVYPGFHPDAVRWLIENRPGILAFGVDSLSCDSGNATEWSSHVLILTSEKLCIENVANLDKIPENGAAEIFAMPLKIRDGTGAPARVYAVWNEHSSANAATTSHRTSPLIFLITIFITCSFVSLIFRDV